MKNPHIRKIISIGLPLLTGNLSHYILNTVDAAMIGRLGTDELAAIAIAGLFTGILFVFVWPVSLGTQAIASRRYGKQAAEENNLELAKSTGEVTDNAVLAGFFAGIFAFFLSFTAYIVFPVLFKESKLIPMALSYTNTIRWGLITVGISMGFRGFLASINKTKPIMISNLGSNLLNIFFNYIFVLKKGGFPLPSLAIKRSKFTLLFQ